MQPDSCRFLPHVPPAKEFFSTIHYNQEIEVILQPPVQSMSYRHQVLPSAHHFRFHLSCVPFFDMGIRLSAAIQRLVCRCKDFNEISLSGLEGRYEHIPTKRDSRVVFTFLLADQQLSLFRIKVEEGAGVEFLPLAKRGRQTMAVVDEPSVHWNHGLSFLSQL